MNAPSAIAPFDTPNFLTDRLVAAVRGRDISQLAQLSPEAGCLAPLLMSLGLQDRVSEIIEALPLRQDSFELSDLRNVLVNLGISTQRNSFRGEEINEALLPCILEDKQGNLYVVTTKEASGYMVYVAAEDQYRLGELPEDTETAFYFTDIRTEIDSEETAYGTSWLTRVLGRFQPLLLQTLAMSLFINILALTPPLFILAVYDGVIGARFVSALPYLIGGVLLALFVESGLRWLRALAMGRLSGRIDYLVATESFRHLLKLPPMAVERNDLGTRLGHLKQFDSVRDFIAGPSMMLIMELPFMPIYVVVVALIAGPLFWIPAAMLIVFALAAFFWVRSSVFENEVGQRQRSHRNQMLFELLGGIADIKSHRAQKSWLARIRESDARSMEAKLSEAQQQAGLRIFGILITGLAGVLTLWAGAVLVMDGDIGVGALIATMVMVWRIGGLSQSLLLTAPKIRPLMGSISHINSVMSIPVEKRSASASVYSEQAEGRVAFDRVSFRYDLESNPALLGCSFEVEPGDMIALTGLSGSGKSTILKLIAGLYRPQSGSIYVDGIDSRQFDPLALRHMLSYLPHETNLLRGSVADNIRLNQPDATDEEVVRAASEANALRLIRNLPDGFNTQVHHVDNHLSSSVTNGICLARTFLRTCPILLLDEPGHNFDNDADKLLTERLAERKGKQTIIVSTHRPSHIALASRVIVLDGGQLIAS